MPHVSLSSSNICSNHTFLETIKAGKLQALQALNYTDKQLQARDHKDNTALHLACAFGFTDIVEFLLSEHVDVEAKNDDNEKALHIAIRKGHYAVVELLLTQGKADIHAPTKEGDLPLHLAIEKGSLDIVNLLLNKGAPVEGTGNHGRTPLQKAVGMQYAGIGAITRRLLLECNANIHALDDEGNTPLHLAVNFYAFYDDASVVALLLSRGAKLEAQNFAGETPLHMAAKSDQLSVTIIADDKKKNQDTVTLQKEADGAKTAVIHYLLKQGANLEAKDKQGNTPLHLASRKREEMVRLLLRMGANIEATNHAGETPLYTAAHSGKTELVKILLDAKANTQAKDNHGNTLMHHAAYGGNVFLLNQLLENHADIDILNSEGKTLLMTAVSQAKIDVIKLLIKRKADLKIADKNKNTVLHYAVNSRNQEVIDLILDLPIDINAQNSEGETALHLAIGQICRSLLERRADVNAKDNRGQTPLHMAAWYGRLKEMRLLLDRGADIDAKNQYDRTPLCIAAQMEKLEAMRLLLDRGADIDTKKSKWTPLHTAAQDEKLEAMRLLLDRGADIDGKDQYDHTPLYLATQCEKLEAMRLLLDRGADIDAKDQYGHTPLRIAAQMEKLEAMRLLLDRGADIDAKDQYDCTPLYIAAEAEKLEAMRLLLDRGADINVRYRLLDTTPLQRARSLGKTKAVELLEKHEKIVQALQAQAQLAQLQSQGKITLSFDALLDSSAVCRGDVAAIEDLIRANHDISIKAILNKLLLNPLLWEQHVNPLPIIQALLNLGTELNATDAEGHTVLHLSVLSGKIDALQQLLDKGAAIQCQDQAGLTPLALAKQKQQRQAETVLQQWQHKLDHELLWTSWKGDIQATKTLLSQGADIHIKDKQGSTAIHLAARQDNLEMLRLLIEQGVAVNSQDNQGNTPLHWLMKEGSITTLKWLLDKGASIYIKNQQGDTPLTLTKVIHRPEVVALLEERQAKTGKQLFKAYHHNELSTLETLIASGADINSKNKQGNTLLIEAVKAGNFAIVDLLIRRGADKQVRDKDDHTLLQLAAQQGNFPIVRLLLNEGMSIHEMDKNGNNLLHLAARGQNSEIVGLLLEKGVDVHSRNKTTLSTPLILADIFARHESVKRLQAWLGAHPVSVTANTAIDTLLKLDNDDKLLHELILNDKIVEAIKWVVKGSIIEPANYTKLISLAIEKQQLKLAATIAYHADIRIQTLTNDGEIKSKLMRMRDELSTLNHNLQIQQRDKNIIHQMAKATAGKGVTFDVKQLKSAYKEMLSQAELAPILEIAMYATHGLHDLADKGQQTGEKLTLLIDPKREDIEEIGDAKQAYGVYYLTQNRIYVAGKRINPELKLAHDKYLVRGTLIHELTHFVAEEVFKNSGNPYSRTNLAPKGTSDQEKFLEIVEILKTLVKKEPIAFHERIGAVFHYSESHWAAELIVRVPQIIAMHPDNKGVQLLQQQCPELLDYYRTVFLPACQQHIQHLREKNGLFDNVELYGKAVMNCAILERNETTTAPVTKTDQTAHDETKAKQKAIVLAKNHSNFWHKNSKVIAPVAAGLAAVVVMAAGLSYTNQ